MKRQASRSRKVPPKLGELIRVVNSVPVDLELPHVNDIIDIHTPSQPKDWHSKFKKFIEQFPKCEYSTFREFIGPLTSQRFVTATLSYRILRSARETFRNIARFNERIPNWEFVPFDEFVGPTIYSKLNERGEIENRLGLDPVREALEGVEAARIRQCPVCGTIYWAGRADQPCCSKRCSNVLRNRRWRENYSDKYKIQRIKKGS